jgi:O-antigen/teichoic acid export membrane protein
MKITKTLIVSNTLWPAVTQFGVMLISLFILPLFIKNLGTELYGIWVLSGVVSGYANVFDFGFTQGLQKYVAEARAKKDSHELSEVVVSGTGLLFLIGLMLGGGLFFGAGAIVDFFSIQPENQLTAGRLLQISAVFCVISWPLRIVGVVLNACMRMKEASILEAVSGVVQSLIMLGMVLAAKDVVLIKWVSSAMATACSMYGLVLLRKYAPQIRWRLRSFHLHQIRRMHKFSLGMFYAALIGMMSIQVDSLVIGKLLGMTAVTAYAIASKLFTLVQRFSTLTITALMPAVYNLNTGDRGRIVRLLEESIRFRMMVSTFLSFGAILINKFFILHWVGKEYLWTVKWSVLFLCICPFIPLSNISTVLRGCGHVRFVNVFVTVKIIVNLVISILLAPVLGIGGPIVGTAVSFSVLGEPGWFSFLNRKIGCSCRKVYLNMVKIIFCFGISLWFSMLVMRVVPWEMVGVVAAVGFYAVLSAGAGFFILLLPEEREQAFQFFKGLHK